MQWLASLFRKNLFPADEKFPLHPAKLPVKLMPSDAIAPNK